MLTAQWHASGSATGGKFSIPRTAAWVLALLVQWALLAALWSPAGWADFKPGSDTARHDVLQLRLVVPQAVPIAIVTAAHRRAPGPSSRPAWLPAHRHAASLPPQPPKPPSSPAPVAVPSLLPAAEVQTSATTAATSYIAGGGLLRPDQDSTFRHNRASLPGVDGVAHAPRFAMADPVEQGLAHRIVSIIGSMGGAVKRQCVDVDTWRGMSAQEQVAHHVSAELIAEQAARYGCIQPARGHP